jgi:hypothetical protein
VRERLRDRSTGDLLVLFIGGTICVCVLIGAVGLIIQSFISDVDHPGAATLVGDTLVALTSLLAGFIAGRSDGGSRSRKDEDKDDAPPA